MTDHTEEAAAARLAVTMVQTRVRQVVGEVEVETGCSAMTLLAALLESIVADFHSSEPKGTTDYLDAMSSMLRSRTPKDQQRGRTRMAEAFMAVASVHVQRMYVDEPANDAPPKVVTPTQEPLPDGVEASYENWWSMVKKAAQTTNQMAVERICNAGAMAAVQLVGVAGPDGQCHFMIFAGGNSSTAIPHVVEQGARAMDKYLLFGDPNKPLPGEKLN